MVCSEEHLKEYKPGWYQSMLLTGKQDKHLADVDEQATIRFEQIVKQMKKAEGVTEELKNENQFVWVQKMNNIQARAMEIIGEELIFV